MKKLYAFIVILTAISAESQIINFPDSAFKDLLFSEGADLNSDGEIEVIEAEQFNSLLIYGNSITNLEGLQYFVNLESLNINNTGSLLSLPDISGMTALNSIDFMNTGLTSLSLGNQSLNNVWINENTQLTQVTINSLELEQLSINNSAVSSLTVGPSNNPFLDVSLLNNQFTALGDLQLDESNFYSYLHFDINTDVLDLTNFTVQGHTLTINNPTMTELIWRAGMHLDWQDQMNIFGQQLIYADFKNNYFDASWGIQTPSSENMINVVGHPSMAICVDDMDIGSDNPELNPPRSEALYFEMIETAQGSPVPFISAYCDQISGSNAIAGIAQFDCGGTPSPIVGIPVTITGTLFNHATTTNTAGNFTLYSFEENVTIAPALENPSWFEVTPANYVFDFEDSGNSVTADFCVSPVGNHPDLDVVILPLDPARPGFDAVYRIVYRNKGNQVLSGSVTFTFDDSRLDYVLASQAPDSQNTGMLTWDFTNLAPFQSSEVTVTLNVNSPTETPAVNNGDVLVFNTEIAPSAGDESPQDNGYVFNQTVVGSLDPNDKQVLEGEALSIAQSGDFLNYIIRFQNMGTFAAENVTIKDVLSNKLDVSSLQVIGASHDFRTAVSHGSQLEFFFEGINLPASQDDEPASHGFVAFKIKPIPGIVANDAIENSAEIYFDFNYPIVTNTVMTTFTELSVPQQNLASLKLYPNPASTHFFISGYEGKVAIYNMLGQRVAGFETPDATGRYDVSGLPAGTYVISSENGGSKLIIR